MTIRVDGPTDGEFRWTIDVVDHAAPAELLGLVENALGRCDRGPIRLWIHAVDSLANRSLIEAGWSPQRDLWQLRRPLPAPPSGINTRGFTPDDLHEFVQVNNRAFDWHPEQGGLTEADVRATMSQPWFRAEGFRLLHIDAQLAGYCWTKIHPETDPPLGEIYVIAIDPAHHGNGLGRPMTLAGLEWLSDQGLTTGMLYVESDNGAANATYARLGFTHHHTDRAYQRTAP